MPTEVEYRNKILEFPDGMSKEEMAAALRKLDAKEAEKERAALADKADKAADANKVPRELFHRLIKVESNWDTKARPVTKSGELLSSAKGLTQLIDSTAKEMGVTDPYDPDQNLHGGAKYLRGLYDKFGDWDKAVAAYHDGPGKVGREGITPDTGQVYLDQVTNADAGPPKLKAPTPVPERTFDPQSVARNQGAPVGAAPPPVPQEPAEDSPQVTAATAVLPPAQAHEVLGIARNQGVPAGVAAIDPAKAQADAAQAAYSAELEKSPGLHAYAAQSSVHAAAFKDNGPELGFLDRWLGAEPTIAQQEKFDAGEAVPETPPGAIESAIGRGLTDLRRSWEGLKLYGMKRMAAAEVPVLPGEEGDQQLREAARLDPSRGASAIAAQQATVDEWTRRAQEPQTPAEAQSAQFPQQALRMATGMVPLVAAAPVGSLATAAAMAAQTTGSLTADGADPSYAATGGLVAGVAATFLGGALVDSLVPQAASKRAQSYIAGRIASLGMSPEVAAAIQTFGRHQITGWLSNTAMIAAERTALHLSNAARKGQLLDPADHVKIWEEAASEATAIIPLLGLFAAPGLVGQLMEAHGNAAHHDVLAESVKNVKAHPDELKNLIRTMYDVKRTMKDLQTGMEEAVARGADPQPWRDAILKEEAKRFVYIDPEHFAEKLAAKGLDPHEVADKVSQPGDLKHSLDTGTPLKVPIENYLVDLKEHHADLRNGVSATADGATLSKTDLASTQEFLNEVENQLSPEQQLEHAKAVEEWKAAHQEKISALQAEHEQATAAWQAAADDFAARKAAYDAKAPERELQESANALHEAKAAALADPSSDKVENLKAARARYNAAAEKAGIGKEAPQANANTDLKPEPTPADIANEISHFKYELDNHKNLVAGRHRQDVFEAESLVKHQKKLMEDKWEQLTAARAEVTRKEAEIASIKQQHRDAMHGSSGIMETVSAQNRLYGAQNEFETAKRKLTEKVVGEKEAELAALERQDRDDANKHHHLVAEASRPYMKADHNTSEQAAARAVYEAAEAQRVAVQSEWRRKIEAKKAEVAQAREAVSSELAALESKWREKISKLEDELTEARAHEEVIARKRSSLAKKLEEAKTDLENFKEKTVQRHEDEHTDLWNQYHGAQEAHEQVLNRDPNTPESDAEGARKADAYRRTRDYYDKNYPHHELTTEQLMKRLEEVRKQPPGPANLELEHSLVSALNKRHAAEQERHALSQPAPAHHKEIPAAPTEPPPTGEPGPRPAPPDFPKPGPAPVPPKPAPRPAAVEPPVEPRKGAPKGQSPEGWTYTAKGAPPEQLLANLTEAQKRILGERHLDRAGMPGTEINPNIAADPGGSEYDANQVELPDPDSPLRRASANYVPGPADATPEALKMWAEDEVQRKTVGDLREAKGKYVRAATMAQKKIDRLSTKSINLLSSAEESAQEGLDEALAAADKGRESSDVRATADQLRKNDKQFTAMIKKVITTGRMAGIDPANVPEDVAAYVNDQIKTLVKNTKKEYRENVKAIIADQLALADEQYQASKHDSQTAKSRSNTATRKTIRAGDSVAEMQDHMVTRDRARAMETARVVALDRADTLEGKLTAAGQTSVRERVYRGGQTYGEAHDMVLEALGIRTPDRNAKHNSFGVLVADLLASGDEIGFDVPHISELTGRNRPVEDLLPKELENVHRAVQNIQELAREELGTSIEGKRKNQAEVISSDIALALAKHREKLALTPLRKLVIGEGKIVNAPKWDAQERHFHTLYQLLGNWGASQRDSLIKARGAEGRLIGEQADLHDLPPEMLKLGNEDVQFPDGMKPEAKAAGLLKRRDVWRTILDSGTVEGLTARSNSWGLTPEQLIEWQKKTVNTPNEWAFIQKQFDLSKKWGDLEAANHSNRSGTPMVRKTPRVFDGPFGKVRGDYGAPVRWLDKTGLPAQTEVNDPKGGLAAMTDTEHGFTKEQTRFDGIIDSSWDRLSSHWRALAHDIAFGDVIRNQSRMFNDPAFKAMLDATSPELYPAMLDMHNTQAKGRMVDDIKMNWVGNALFTTTRGIQANSIFNTNFRVSTGMFSHFLAAKNAAPMDLWSGFRKLFQPSAWELARSASPDVVGYRADRTLSDYRETDAAIQRGAPINPVARLTQTINHFLYHGADSVLTQWFWHAIHDRAIAEGRPSSEAIKFATTETDRILPSPDVYGKSMVAKDPLLGTYLMVRNFENTIWNVKAFADFEARAKIFNGADPLKTNSANIGRRLGIAGGLAIGYYLMGHGRNQHEQEEDRMHPGRGTARFVGRNLFEHSMFGNPLIHEVASSIAPTVFGEGFNTHQVRLLESPTTELVHRFSADLGKVYAGVHGTAKPSEALLAGLDAAGRLLGAPVSLERPLTGTARSVKYLMLHQSDFKGAVPYSPIGYAGKGFYGDTDHFESNPASDSDAIIKHFTQSWR